MRLQISFTGGAAGALGSVAAAANKPRITSTSISSATAAVVRSAASTRLQLARPSRFDQCPDNSANRLDFPRRPAGLHEDGSKCVFRGPSSFRRVEEALAFERLL